MSNSTKNIIICVLSKYYVFVHSFFVCRAIWIIESFHYCFCEYNYSLNPGWNLNKRTLSQRERGRERVEGSNKHVVYLYFNPQIIIWRGVSCGRRARPWRLPHFHILAHTHAHTHNYMELVPNRHQFVTNINEVCDILLEYLCHPQWVVRNGYLVSYNVIHGCPTGWSSQQKLFRIPLLWGTRRLMPTCKYQFLNGITANIIRNRRH